VHTKLDEPLEHSRLDDSYYSEVLRMKSDTSLYETRLCSRLVFNRAPSIAGDSAHPTLTAKYDHSSRVNPEASRTPHPPTLSTCQPLDTLIPRKAVTKSQFFQLS
jgi:hypothetical protein